MINIFTCTGGQNFTQLDEEILTDDILEDVFVEYLAKQNYTTLEKLGHKYNDFVFECNFRGNDCRYHMQAFIFNLWIFVGSQALEFSQIITRRQKFGASLLGLAKSV